MKTLSYLLLTTGLMLTSYQTASAQCQIHPGYQPKAVAPGFDRYYQFQIEGRAFTFDRQTSEIFCSGIKIGVRTPDGQVQLDPAAVGRIEGPAGGATVPPTKPAVPPVQPGVPAVQPGVPAVQPGVPPVQPGVTPAQPGVTPVQPGVKPAQPGVTPAQPGVTPAQPGVNPAQPGVIPPATGTIPTVNNATPPIPDLGSGAVAQINPAFTGQWRAENKNIFGRSTLRELTIEGNSMTLRVQTGGEEANLIEGTMEIKDGKLTVKGSNEDVNLGAISVNNGQLVLAGDETLTFKRVEE